MLTREPDETFKVKLHDKSSHADVTVQVWIEPTDTPWDGEDELEENAEGYDILAEARIEIDRQTFKSFASLGSVWIVPSPQGSAYLKDEQREVVMEAVSNLNDEIKLIAKGRDVDAATLRQRIAISIK